MENKKDLVEELEELQKKIKAVETVEDAVRAKELGQPATEEPVVEMAKVTPTEVPQEVPQEAAQQRGLTLSDLKEGYVVGVTQEGHFVFDILGETTLVGLMGLHAHATRKVDITYNQKQNVGDALTLEVAKMVQHVSQQVQRVVEVINPTKPDNKLG